MKESMSPPSEASRVLRKRAEGLSVASCRLLSSNALHEALKRSQRQLSLTALSSRCATHSSLIEMFVYGI